jgi:hypothetical protein
VDLENNTEGATTFKFKTVMAEIISYDNSSSYSCTKHLSSKSPLEQDLKAQDGRDM